MRSTASPGSPPPGVRIPGVADAIVKFDYTADEGVKFPSQSVRDEIAVLGRSTVDPGSVTESALAPAAVTNSKLAPGAVDTSTIATNGVHTVNLIDEIITEAKIALGAVTLEKIGAGVLSVVDFAGNAINARVMLCTAAQFASLATKDPNTIYLRLP